jgi:hypothetical protein
VADEGQRDDQKQSDGKRRRIGVGGIAAPVAKLLPAPASLLPGAVRGRLQRRMSHGRARSSFGYATSCAPRRMNSIWGAGQRYKSGINGGRVTVPHPPISLFKQLSAKRLRSPRPALLRFWRKAGPVITRHPPAHARACGGSSTPRPIDPITGVSGILDHPRARMMTAEGVARRSFAISPQVLRED